MLADIAGITDNMPDSWHGPWNRAALSISIGGSAMCDIFYLAAACSCANTVFALFSIILTLEEHGLFCDIKLKHERRRKEKALSRKDDAESK